MHAVGIVHESGTCTHAPNSSTTFEMSHTLNVHACGRYGVIKPMYPCASAGAFRNGHVKCVQAILAVGARLDQGMVTYFFGVLICSTHDEANDWNTFSLEWFLFVEVCFVFSIASNWP